MKPRLPVLIAALALAAGAAPCEQLPLKVYTTADGLPSDRIHCILPDSRGFLWIGTSDGVSRFDGYTFRNFGEADGLPATAVPAILETRDGGYWLGTGRGLFRLRTSRACCIRRRPPSSTSTSTPTHRARTSPASSSKERRIWAPARSRRTAPASAPSTSRCPWRPSPARASR